MTEVPEGPPTLPSGIEVIRTESGLEYIEIEPGDGNTAKLDDEVQVQFHVWLTEGTNMDAALHGGAPMTFSLSQEEVIAGLDEGVLGMRPGGVRRLIVPSDLAYGPGGHPPHIPPYATLIFDIKRLA